ncbi:hypothetical protein Pint_24304 [Pistacia integerrima]|uniref:Uncharacterized protein n=1 Tax=Pistacia integerrima TaxID=434235 RepID=A0ACC0YEY2_9ROSI|nr:hypothetical protein Pint_24304 [Pistacia integerrima]
MDHVVPVEKKYLIDLESGCVVSEDGSREDTISGVKKQVKMLLAKVCSRFMDGSMKGEDNASLCSNVSSADGVSVENLKGASKDDEGKKVVKEKRKKSSNKKAPKPPKPPRGPSLDSADLKLIKEITEIAMLKRARIERMKALKKMKAAKQSSPNSNILAMVFTVLFCLVIIFQGLSSGATKVNFEESPVSTGSTEGGLISVHFTGNPAPSNANGPGFPNLVEQVAVSDPHQSINIAAG